MVDTKVLIAAALGSLIAMVAYDKFVKDLVG